MGLVACSSGGGGRQKASSLPVLFCLELLFLPASGLDVDSGDCVLIWWRCGVCILYVSACVFKHLCVCPVFLTA